MNRPRQGRTALRLVLAWLAATLVLIVPISAAVGSLDKTTKSSSGSAAAAAPTASTGQSPNAGQSKRTSRSAQAPATRAPFAAAAPQGPRTRAAAQAGGQTTVSLEFDDENSDQYQAGAMLATHGMHGTFFVNSGRIGTDGYMTLAQLQALQSGGNEIGGHTINHVDLPTLPSDAATRQICNDRVTLLNDGFQVRNFAYPFGDYTSAVESTVQGCGYNSGRTIGGIHTSKGCNGCDFAETIPPADLYASQTPDSITADMSLSDIEGLVTQAEDHGGGWVQLVMHHICDGCDPVYAVSPATLSAFLDWLQLRSSQNTVVKTVFDVIGGAVQPPVSGPPAATTVSLTFDDSTSDQGQVQTLLSSHGMHGTFFVNSGTVGSTSSYLTWAQLSSLASDGNEIGGHTVSHANLLQVSASEAQRQICNDRVTITGHGFSVTDFAYPYGAGAHDTGIQGIVQGCGYNSGRDISGIVSPSGCTGCPTAESIPPRNLFDTRAPDSITSDMSLSTIEGFVTQAEQTSGGWVQLVFHHVCNSGCDPYNVTSANLKALLDWLQPRSAQGTVVKTVHDVIGGAAQPLVQGPPPTNQGTVVNPSLETDSNGDGVPDCWSTATTGTNSSTFTRTSDAHTGGNAERIDVSNYSTGDAKVILQQDLGDCSPPITVGHSYKLSEWYKGSGSIAFQLYTRNAAGGWAFCKQTSWTYPASTTWTQAQFTWPATSSCSSGPTALSFGLALVNNGSLTVDDASIQDLGATTPDITAPTTTISCNGAPCSTTPYTGAVTVTLNASDTGTSGGAASGVMFTKYTTDNSSGPALNPPAGLFYSGSFTLTSTTTVKFRSIDTAGNQEACCGTNTKTITVTADATPPTSTIACNGGPCSGWFKSPASVTLSATDTGGSGLKAIYYTTDGSDPTTSSPSYTSALSLTATKTVKYRAQDLAGNLEATNSQLVQVDGTAPTSTIACNGGSCGGTFAPGASVTLSAADESGGSGLAAIYYTTDGTDPTTSSSVYSSALTLNATTTVKFRAADVAGNLEATNSQTVQVVVPDTTAPTSSITCNGGSCGGWFASPATVALSAADDSGGSGVAAIYYTTDGTDPTTASPAYSSPFPLTATATVKYMALDNAGNLEAAKSQLVQVDGAAPTSTIACNGGSCSGTFAPGASVTLSASDENGGSGLAAIYYTTDGTDPTTSSSVYSSALTLNATTTVKFRAADVAGNLEATNTQVVQVVVPDTTAPTSSIACNGGGCGGWFASQASVALTATDDSGGSGVAAIYYTIDGSTPTTSSLTYTAPLTLNATTTVKFRAADVAGNLEATNSQLVQVDGTPPTSSIACNGGSCGDSFTTSVSVALSATDDGGGSGVAAIYYTTDGSDPTTSSSVYSNALTLNATTTVKFRAADVAGNLEATNSQLVQVVADTTAPTTSITCNGTGCSNWYTAAPVTVTLSALDNAGGSGVSAIYYTTNGTDPTTSSSVYTSPLVINSTTTVKYRAIDVAGNLEATNAQQVGVDTTPPTSSIKCNSGTCATSWYTAAVSVSLSAADTGGSGPQAIYYTTDGTDPTTSSTVYTQAFSLSASATVKFRARDVAGNLEAVNSRSLLIDTTAPTTTATCNNLPCSNWFPGTVSLTLTASDGAGGSGVAVTRYTLNGTAPSKSSPVYTTPLSITATDTVKFRSWDNVGIVEATKSAKVQIDTIAPTVSITAPANGAKVKGTVTIKASASDSGGAGVASVAFYVDGVLLGTDTVSSWTMSWNTTTATKTTHTLTAIATDSAGNTKTSTAITVTVT